MTIIIHDSFFAEKQYIIDVLLGEYLGLKYTVETSPEHNYKITFKNGKTLTFEDSFFKHCKEEEGYLHQKNIPNHIEHLTTDFTTEKELPVLFGNSATTFDTNNISYGLDIFASAFFMLTRWEEYVLPVRDQHDRFPASTSLAFQFDFLLRPIVNEYTALLWNLIQHLSPDIQRKKRHFSTLLTHDVDTPFLWNQPLSGLKTIAGDLLKRQNISAAKQHFSYWKKGKDPFDTFDALMDLSEKHHLQSHFFFISGGNTDYEGHYKITDPKIQQLLARIQERGHGIGIHPSYGTYKNIEQLKREKNALQAVSPQAVIAGRQHFLRWATPDSWQDWEDAGLQWDSTMGYAAHIGFRCGTCYPFPVFNVLTRKKLQLIERPLLVMEVSLFSKQYMQLDQPTALRHVQKMIQTVRQYNGEFVLLWHNSNLVLNGEDYWDIYTEILNVLVC